ncbi:glycosyltransferase [Xanthobacter sp. V3C-3]|uniref:nucleotide disphospho-sugar-binding domain-containing protein n=1 Tax=Xanthobacter lutulentifluminis TaxID=3119935 RepID=UPI003727ADB4
MEPTPALAGRLRIVVAGWKGGGNVPPTISAVAALCARGHEVTVVADDSIAGDARAAGARFVGWKRAPNRPDRSAASCFVRDTELADPFAAFAAWCERIFVGPSEAQARDLIEVMTVQPTDVLVASDLLFGSVLAGEVAQLPTAILSTNVSISPLPGHPPFGPGFLPAETAADHERDRSVAAWAEEMWNGFLPGLNAARQALGRKPLARVLDQLRAADLHLLATSPAFDYPAAALPPDVRYVGPLLDEPSWIAGGAAPVAAPPERPLVLVSFSTTDQGQSGALETIISALGELPVEAVVTLGNVLERFGAQIPPNVRVLDSASHEAILPHAALVITHGGHGTTLRALRHGVPLLILPMGRDQNENAARVAYHGVGLRLDAASAAPVIADAIARLLWEPDFATSARRMGEALRAEPPAAERFVAAIEQLHAQRRAHPTCAA